MKNFFVLSIVAVGLSGCGGGATLPTAPDALFKGISSEENTERKLISDFNQEDRMLIYLSQGNYSCGDPTSQLLQQYKEIKNPDQFVRKEFEEGAWTSSIQLIHYYYDTLNQIKNSDKVDDETIDNLSGALASVASYAPQTAAFSGVVKPVAAVMKDFRDYITDRQFVEFARRMNFPLTIAVAYLEKPQVLEYFSRAQRAFSVWDSCARETLAYLLDLGDENFESKYGPSQSKSVNHPHLTPPTARELQEARLAYIAQRSSYDLNIDFKKILDDILVQNKRLIQSGSKLSISGFLSAAGDFCSAAGAISKAAGIGASCSSPAASKDAKTGDAKAPAGAAAAKPSNI
ncbi:hypothetical protein [Methylocella sp.]|uniref:hypothetical protein n=1 Tax=Methylocella sp. TaxID=1978226 RepID=UPI00378452BB